MFVIDRAVNSKALALAFDEAGLGLLCLLNDHEHDGLESFEVTEVEPLDDGVRLYQGPWKESRPDDSRHFVIVKASDAKTLVYWGNTKVEVQVEAAQWPDVHRTRTELQENAFKAMIDHGALDINVGRKTIVGPDRHQ